MVLGFSRTYFCDSPNCSFCISAEFLSQNTEHAVEYETKIQPHTYLIFFHLNVCPTHVRSPKCKPSFPLFKNIVQTKEVSQRLSFFFTIREFPINANWAVLTWSFNRRFYCVSPLAQPLVFPALFPPSAWANQNAAFLIILSDESLLNRKRISTTIVAIILLHHPNILYFTQNYGFLFTICVKIEFKISSPQVLCLYNFGKFLFNIVI
jgi:hypothetical protein